MAHRVFVDSYGVKWDVWSVHPTRVERRESKAAPWTGTERRTEREYRVSLGRDFSGGWLAFETQGEKRRIAPIPEGWEGMGPAELEELLVRAKVVTPSRRLVE